MCDIYKILHGYMDIYSKQLSHTIMEAGKYKICRVHLEGGDPEKSQCCSQTVKAVHLQNWVLLGGGQCFVPVLVQLPGLGPSKLWKMICFTQSPPV